MSGLGPLGPRGWLIPAVAAWPLWPAAPAVRADHVGTLQLNGDRVGPYALSVWTQPTPPRAGTCLVAVAVMRPDTHAPVPAVAVRVTAEPPDRAGEPVTTEASRDRDPLGLRYLAELTLPWAG
jgi:hypothetical protein